MNEIEEAINYYESFGYEASVRYYVSLPESSLKSSFRRLLSNDAGILGKLELTKAVASSL